LGAAGAGAAAGAAAGVVAAGVVAVAVAAGVTAGGAVVAGAAAVAAGVATAGVVAAGAFSEAESGGFPSGTSGIRFTPYSAFEAIDSNVVFTLRWWLPLFAHDRTVPVSFSPGQRGLNPLECALLPDPNIAEHQDSEEDQHLYEPVRPKLFELHCPWEEEDCLHVENYK